MLIVRIQINLREVAMLGLVNTGHRTKTKGNLYRVNYPGWAKNRYNHLKIYHNVKDSWTVLTEKVLKAINKFDKGKEKEVEKLAYEYAINIIRKPKDIKIKEETLLLEKLFREQNYEDKKRKK